MSGNSFSRGFGKEGCYLDIHSTCQPRRSKRSRSKKQVTTNVVTCWRSPSLSSLDPLLAATAWTTGSSSFLLRLCLTWLHSGCRLRGFSARRTDPDFNEIAVAIAAIENGDSPRIDSALRHE